MTRAIREKSLNFHGKDEDGMNHTRTHKTVRSLLVWLLLLTMVFGLLPMAAFADEAGEPALEVTEPTPEPETTPEPEQPEPTQEPETTPEPEQPGDADVTIEGDEELEVAALTNNTVELNNEWLNPSPSDSYNGEFMKIFFLDCGRKYFSVENIKKLIDNASAAGFNYVQLAVGNDGLRFLLDDMSLTVKGVYYNSQDVSAAIHAGNEKYYNFTVDELTQSEMDTIIAYAKEKKMGVIPCVNTPGHMDAILSAATALTGKTCSYSGSVRTIDVTNATAVAFTQALLQKYIDYFKGKGCQFFNMGADEYANDIYTGGAMGFGNLQSTGKYSYYVQYVNQVADKIKKAGMTPMAFNDGIYFANNTWSGTFDTDIVICYWSNGWSGYSPMSASSLRGKNFSLVNTNGSYYWVLGKADAQCSSTKAAGFDKTVFPGSTISDPSGAMFCIWCDYPGADTAENVVSNTAATIAAFGNPPTTGGGSTGGSTGGDAGTLVELKVGKTSEGRKTTAAEGAADTKDASVATASVTKGTATEKTLKEITSESELSADKQYLIVNNRQNAMLTATPSTWEGNNCLALNGAPTVDSTNLWKITQSGSYYTIQYVNGGKYLNIGDNTASVGNSAKLTLSYNSTISGWNISYYNYRYTYYLNDLGNTANAGGWKYTYNNNAVNDPGSKWRIYEIAETTAASSNVLTFTGTGEGETTASIGGVEYTIKVTARETTETKTLNFGESFALPEGAEEVTIDGTAVNLNGGSIVAGDAVGTATVTAVVKNEGGKVTDRYTYNISVTDQAPDGSMTSDTITLEHWITNAKVGSTSGATDNTQTIANTYEGITSADGVEISTFARNPGHWNDIPVKYWQAMRLDSAYKQTDENGVDRTSKGTTLTHIRYSGAWQYKTADGAWHYFKSDDQLVAYYLQQTDVTKEITTFTKDWGHVTSKDTPYNGEGQAALSVAVVYPDGQLSPTEDKIYSQSTTIFNFWIKDGIERDIGIVAPVNNSDYNISKITVTDGARTNNTSANQWYTSDTITWQKETTASGGQWYKEKEVWNKSFGTTPMVNGAASNIRWSEKNTAKLILIYLEPVEKDTNLEIVYYDDTASRNIKSYQVSMKYNQGEAVPTFDTALMRGNEPIGKTKNWPGKTAEASDYLPDDAYVVNSKNIRETFNKNLTELPGIADNYKSGIYEYNGANISEDGKTLTLHYKVKTFENSKTIVVDFGLPVEVTGLLGWFGVTDSSTVKDISLATGTALYDSVGTYGRAVINQNTYSLTYTLQKLIDAEISIPLYLNFKSDAGQLQRQLKVIPATNVYYEDSFVGEGFKNGTGTAASAVWELDGTEKTAKQALSELGSKNIYGNDGAYNNSSKFSMGSAKTVTVESGMLNGWDDTSAWPTATFTFKGTGFDIISLTNNKSGSIFVDVYAGAKAEGNRIKSYIVNNYYGYTYENGDWVVKQGEGDTLYQIPVMKIRDLDYGEYTAVVTVFYDGAFNSTGTEKCSFWFDGFRVYDPMGKNVSDYTMDKEGYPQYIKLRTEIINKNETNKGNATALFIDGAKEATVEQYKNFGPNNEVYLGNGQAISFKLPANTNIATVQIGAKSPNASDTVKPTMSVKINDTTLDPKEIGTATEMYYKISESGADAQQVTITNTGKAILSLTNIKITYSEKSTTELAALSEGDEQAAVAAVRALYAAPVVEPVEPFKPGRFETSWSSNVRKGSRAVLTVKASTDVDAIVVNGVTVTQFKTCTERIGYGWNAKRVTYREFSYMMTANEVGTINIPVVAVSNDLGSSAAYDSTLTVKPSSPIRDWIGGIFGRWF